MPTLREFVYLTLIPKVVWGHKLTSKQQELLNRWTEKYQINKEVFSYYTNKKVLFEIVKYLGNKEFCLNSNIRWLYANKIEHLIYCFYFYKIFERPKSGYCGLSEFSHREQPPFNPIEKKKWQDNYWTGGGNAYLEAINGYNFGIDLDADTFEESYKDAKKIFELFNHYKIKFSIWCSGKKGWHIIVPFEEFSSLIKPFDVDNAVTFCKSMALDLRDKLKLKKIDEIIYSPTRFLKCPYTLDSRNNRVIFPLSKEEFLNFKDYYMSIEYCLKQENLGFRGAYLNRQSNPIGIKKMIEGF